MTEQTTRTIDPFAAAAHHKATAQFFENRCMLLQDTVIKQEAMIAYLRETITQRDDEITRLDAHRDPTTAGGGEA